MSYVMFIEFDGTRSTIRFRTLRAARSAAYWALEGGRIKSAHAWRA